MFKKSLAISFLLILQCLLLQCFLLTTNSTAESSKIELLHTPLKDDSLPLPGDMIELKVLAQGTKYIDLPLRLIAVLDNKLIDLMLPAGSITPNEQIQYSVSIPSPLESLQYQFIGFDSSKQVLTSKWYSLKRPCNFDTSAIKIDMQAIQNNEHAEELFNIATKLERELIAYKSAYNLLQEVLSFKKNSSSE